MVLSVITKDEDVIFCKRSINSGFRAGQSDISIVKGISHELYGKSNLMFDAIAKRAFEEEICQIDSTSLFVNILGFIFDKDYNQWNLAGCIKVNKSHEQLVALRNSGTKGKWELKDLDFIKCTPKDMMLYIAQHDMWGTAQLTAYWALIFNGYSKKKHRQIRRKVN